MQSACFKLEWQNPDKYRELVNAFHNNTKQILIEHCIHVLRDDTSIYDCSGQITIGHKNGTTIIVDNNDYTYVSVEAIGQNEEIAHIICEKLKELVRSKKGKFE